MSRVTSTRIRRNPTSQQSGEVERHQQSTKHLLNQAQKTKKRLRVLTRLSFLLAFYPIQLILAAMFLVSIGFGSVAEYVPFGLGDTPAQLAIGIGFALMLVFGVCTMLVALFVLLFTGIPCMKNKGGLIFTLATFFYVVPGLNFFPWVYWWGWYVGGQ